MIDGRLSQLERVLRPASVAVVGATESLGKTGGRRLRSLITEPFRGPIYPIHPTAPTVQGLQAYPNLLSTPLAADIAVLAIPAEQVPAVVEEGLRRGVGGFICITAGYAETGSLGRAAQDGLVQAVRRGNARLIGPNSNGLFFRASGLNVTGLTGIPVGPVAVISQSGNIAHAFVRMAKARGTGVSALLTVGNSADVTAIDLLPILAEDSMTRAICLYLEGFPENEGERLLETVWGLKSRKPILAVVAGSTEAGQRAIASHTGMLATEDRALNAILKAAGVTRVGDIDIAFDVATALSVGRLPAAGSGAVILCDSGGPGSMAADALARLGVPIPIPSDAVQAQLRKLVPNWGSTRNPVDFAGRAEADPSVIARALRICLGHEGIGAALIAGHFGGYGDLTAGLRDPQELAAADEISKLSNAFDKPVVIHSINAREDRPALQLLVNHGVHSYETVTRACEVVSALFAQSALITEPVNSGGLRDRDNRRQDTRRFRSPKVLLSEAEGRSLLNSLGMPIPDWKVATSRANASKVYEEFGGATLAAKVVSSSIVHKSDVGGVVLGISSATQAAIAYDQIKVSINRLAPGTKWDGVLFTPMVAASTELSAGYVLHSQMGPLVMVGFGGVWVEVLQDIALRPASVLLGRGATCAREMLRELRGWPILEGNRGLQINVEPIVTILLGLARLSQVNSDVVEVDLNPVMVNPSDAVIADVRVMVARSQ